MSATSQNPYIPRLTTIRKITVENDAQDIRTFELVFASPKDAAAFTFECGQFAMVSVTGVGESPFGIASSPREDDHLRFTVKRYATGLLTTALHSMQEGDVVGVRGPYGNSYPLKQMEGKDVVIVAGGFAFTTLRATIRFMLHESNRKRFGKITVVYGARSPGELIYKPELKEWEDSNEIDMNVTVDKGDAGWTGREGFVPTVLQQVAPSSTNAMVLVCGPPIMLKFTMPPLLDLGFDPENIITSLERRMSCGIGKCGRCNVGSKYVCKDGPVFSFKEAQNLPEAII